MISREGFIEEEEIKLKRVLGGGRILHEKNKIEKKLSAFWFNKFWPRPDH